MFRADRPHTVDRLPIIKDRKRVRDQTAGPREEDIAENKNNKRPRYDKMKEFSMAPNMRTLPPYQCYLWTRQSMGSWPGDCRRWRTRWLS